MKKLVLTLGMGLAVMQASAQLVNNGAIHISEGALVSVGMETINNGTLDNKGNLELRNNLSNNADFSSTGMLTLRSESGITVNGSRGLVADRVSLDSDVQLQTSLGINKSLEFNNGLIYSSENAGVNFGSEANHSLSNDFSHIVGKVSKSGNGSFTFPVGDGYARRAFDVTDLGGRTIEASYVAASPLDIASGLDYDVEEINSQEYWMIKSNNASKVDVRLTNSDVVAVENGLWSNSRKGVSVTRDGAAFTSGRAKHFIKEIGVWPNPTSGEFNLKLTGMRDSDDITVDITNQDGRVIQSLKGKVSELRKAYRLPSSMATTNLKVRVINGDEVLTQSLILNK
jgi:hypothetical protein